MSELAPSREYSYRTKYPFVNTLFMVTFEVE